MNKENLELANRFTSPEGRNSSSKTNGIESRIENGQPAKAPSAKIKVAWKVRSGIVRGSVVEEMKPFVPFQVEERL